MAAGPSLDDRDPRGRGKGRGSKKSGKGLSTVTRAGRAGRPTWLRVARIGATVAVLGLFAGIAVLVGIFSYYGSDPKLPDLARLDTYRPKQVTRILARTG